MPLGHGAADADACARERAVLSVSTSVVTTSAWSRRRLLELYSLPDDRVHVAEPGVDPAPLAPGTAGGGAFLCVAAVTPGKGHDLLVGALATLRALSWGCLCIGSLEREPRFVKALRHRVSEAQLTERVRFTGPRTGRDVEQSYATAD